MTKYEELIDALQTLGFERIQSKSRKYDTFKGRLPGSTGRENYYSVGKMGALRDGRRHQDVAV